VKTWKSQGGMFKKHVGQGKVRELFFGYSFLYMSNYYTLREKTNYKTKPQGVCSVITTLRPTHIRNHSPSAERLKRRGRAFDYFWLLLIVNLGLLIKINSHSILLGLLSERATLS